MKQVLFVDDDLMVLQGLRRLLRPATDQWQMHFEQDSAKALARLEKDHYDVVVSDMRMPVYTGVDVLRHAQEHCPDAVRIGLSGYADAELALKAARVAHQFLAKPCDCQALIRTVDKLVRLQERLRGGAVTRSVGALSSLPSLPSLYLQVTEEAKSPTGSLESVGRIISRDLAMTTKLLQLVNSAYFGLKIEVTAPVQAATILGMDAIRSIVLTVGLFDTFKGNMDPDDLQQLWRRSISAGGNAKSLAACLQLQPKARDQALLGGMLHDVGALVIMAQMPEPYCRIKARLALEPGDCVAAEEAILGCSHADLGTYLLTLWGFSESVIEAVAYHHCPSESGDDNLTPLTVVHVASAMASGDVEAARAQLDMAYLERVGARSKVEDWLEARSESESAEIDGA